MSGRAVGRSDGQLVGRSFVARLLTILPSVRPTVLILTVLASVRLTAQCPDGTPPPCRGARVAPRMSIAVLDFQNLSRDTGDSWLGQGIAGELTSRLGQVSRLTVASRSAVQRLQNPATMRLADVGRSLNASYIVNGTVQRAGARLRVTAELVRVSNGAQVWSDQFDRTETDLLAIQEAVATAVATAVTGRLLPSERTVLAAQPTRSPEAHAAYLRGRALMQGVTIGRNDSAAIAAFERAVQIDSLYVDAWAQLAIADAEMYWLYTDRSEARVERARVAAERARAIAPDAAITHMALGYYYYWGRRDFARAQAEFAAALAREPNNATAHSALANVARRQGDFTRSLASRVRSTELDPENYAELDELGLTLMYVRRYEDAEAAAARAKLIDPRASASPHALFAYAAHDGSVRRAPDLVAAIASNMPAFTAGVLESPEFTLPLLRLSDTLQSAVLLSAPPSDPHARAGFFLAVGQALAVRHREREAGEAYDSARAIVGRLLEERPFDDGFHAAMALAYAGLSDCERALYEIGRASDIVPIEADALRGSRHLIVYAQIEAQCGRFDQASVRLDFLLHRPAPISIALLRFDPIWTPLHGTVRYERILAGR